MAQLGEQFTFSCVKWGGEITRERFYIDQLKRKNNLVAFFLQYLIIHVYINICKRLMV